MSNFKFLLSDPGFVPFAEVLIAAENGGKMAIPQIHDKLDKINTLLQKHFG